MAGMAWGQTYESVEDSLLAIDRDTVNSQLSLGTVGDVFAGFDIGIEPAHPLEYYIYADSSHYTFDGNDYVLVSYDTIQNKHRNAIRFYHKDKQGNKIRQIVVLRDRWSNLPEDLATCGESYEGRLESYTYTGLSGFKLAALTPKEYTVAKRLGDIWGEVFEVCYPRNYPYWSDQKDTIPNYPGYEIICYSDSIADLRRFTDIGPKQRRYSREIMSYTDSITGIKYLCAAPNRSTGMADYTPSASNGKYDTRWVIPSPYEQAYWIRKYKRYYGLEKPYISM